VPLTARALFAFGVLITSAALAYPGGTWRDRSSPGFSFWNNFWCDLLSTRALDGRSNLLGAGLSRAAFVCFALALFQFWPLVAVRANPARPSRAAQTLGRVGAASLLVVALVPAATSQLGHGVAVVSSTSAALLAVSVLLPGLVHRREHGAALLGVTTLAVSLWCLGLYVYQGCFGGAVGAQLAGLQKIATALLLAFMVHVLMRSRVGSSLTGLDC
jgi:hypothetical protein